MSLTKITYLTEVFDLANQVMRKIDAVQLIQPFKIFDLVDQVVMKKKTPHFDLIFEVSNFTDSVVLQKQALQSCVLVEILDK